MTPLQTRAVHCVAASELDGIFMPYLLNQVINRSPVKWSKEVSERTEMYESMYNP